jgi:flagellin
MAINIQTNVSSLETQGRLASSQKALQSSFQKLSSGFRVNSASDDAAGLAISEGMKSQIRSYAVAERNAADGISMAQTAEGSLGEVHGILGRMRELAMQASNGSLSGDDRGYLDKEFSLLNDEVTRIQESTSFNGVKLVGGSASSVTFQVGLNNASSDQIKVEFGNLSLSSLTSASLAGTGASSALSALKTIDDAIKTVSDSRSNFGSAMNRLQVATSNIQTMKLNLSAANSRIVDVDVADETSKMSRNQVLSQAGVSVLAQANQIPQMALGLLRG